MHLNLLRDNKIILSTVHDLLYFTIKSDCSSGNENTPLNMENVIPTTYYEPEATFTNNG